MSLLLKMTSQVYEQMLITTSDPSTSYSNGSYTYRFPSVYQAKEGNKIALQNITMFYSWDNITTAFNNKQFSYQWVDGTTHSITLPDGFYEISDISQYIWFIFQQNGHYLVDGNGNNVYFLNLQNNPTYYSFQLNATIVPTSLPSGWTNPNSIPLSGTCPQLIVSSSNNFGSVIGFTAGTYPSSNTSNASVLSNLAPKISPVNQVYVTCSLVNSGRFTSRYNVIGSFVPSVQFGSLITFTPPVPTFFNVSPNVYPTITISLLDSNFNPLQIIDNSATSFSLLHLQA